MISKIIQKEKERQVGYLEQRELKWENGKALCLGHKQSLINLKEYMEEKLRKMDVLLHGSKDNDENFTIGFVDSYIYDIKEDIEELTKMIEAYK